MVINGWSSAGTGKTGFGFAFEVEEEVDCKYGGGAVLYSERLWLEGGRAGVEDGPGCGFRVGNLNSVVDSLPLSNALGGDVPSLSGSPHPGDAW